MDNILVQISQRKLCGAYFDDFLPVIEIQKVLQEIMTEACKGVACQVVEKIEVFINTGFPICFREFRKIVAHKKPTAHFSPTIQQT